ncbi:MAG TPA: pyridoxamine 5'-phosphate oxidase family protein [Methylomirabilota bacterium]|jgi:PPOX class probable FMN-dependent enzyme
MFQDLVRSEAELRALVGEPSPRARLKQLAALDEHCRAFIARAPFVLVATADAEGRCDVSPKGDAPGFVRVLDDRHLLVPDRRGNRRLDGMRNILANPHVGLLFIVPGREDTLRVNGRAWVTRDAALLSPAAVDGKAPLLGIGVEVQECFLHCARSFKRARLWQAETWDSAGLPSMQRILWDQIPACRAGTTFEEYDRESRSSLEVLY